MFKLGLSFGHGGPLHNDHCDDGARCSACGTKAGARWGVVEADFIREFGEAFYEILPHDWCHVVRLNESHETVGPATRARRAEAEGTDLNLLLHVNEGASGAHGGHFFHSNGDGLARRLSMVAAPIWPTALSRELLPRERRGKYIAGMVEDASTVYGGRALWPRAKALLDNYSAPTVLAELFYASSEVDCVAARSPFVQLRMAAGLLAMVAEAGEVFGVRACGSL